MRDSYDSSNIYEPLDLPCGARLPNRIAKAAMTEGMATPEGHSTAALERLYSRWSQGEAGLLITGNIIIDRDHLERPGNIIIDRKPDANMAERLTRLASAATQKNNHCWAQISHAGRQTPALVNPRPKSSSDVKLGLPGGQFGEPVPLKRDEIVFLIERWAIAAKACYDAGFTGVQIHAAHGYLVSQFLSPRVNLRSDDYGGCLENRARFLLEIVAAIRAKVGSCFPVSVKLNSADFQKGGFAFSDSLQVAQWLEEASVDLIEISGGTYEQPKLLGIDGIEQEEPQSLTQAAPASPESESPASPKPESLASPKPESLASPKPESLASPKPESLASPKPESDSTLVREAYFVDFARAMQAKVTVPLMVTGGFRTRKAMEQALRIGAADVIGIARPMCVMTDAPKRLRASLPALPRYEDDLRLLPDWLGFLKGFQTLKAIDSFARIYWFYEQLWKLGREDRSDESINVFKAFRSVEKRGKAIMKARAALAVKTRRS